MILNLKLKLTHKLVQLLKLKPELIPGTDPGSIPDRYHNSN
jgi:hypothetical protein